MPKAPSESPLARVYPHVAFPTDLKVEQNHQRLSLSWRKSGQGPIAGYYIYASDRPLTGYNPNDSLSADISPLNSVPFPGDTNPEDSVENYEVSELSNGVKYHISIRAVYPDQVVSRPSNEVIAVCGGRGEIELAVRYFGKPGGFSFERNEYVEYNAPDNDLYFFSKDSVDYLASPRRLEGFISDTRFLVLPLRGEYADVAARVRETKPTPTDDQVEVTVGDWVLLKCERGTHALVQVKELRGLARQRRVKLFFAYSSFVGEFWF
ncbi:MAG: fibronectin type III domain-containing protein [Candidatus Zixiibacteriota bacterium]